MPRQLRPCGTVASYIRGCRCDECKSANNSAAREYRVRRNSQGRPISVDRKRTTYSKRCAHCDAAFTTTTKTTRFCSVSCGKVGNNKRPRELVHVGPTTFSWLPSDHLVMILQRRIKEERPTSNWWTMFVAGSCSWCEESFTARSSTGLERYCSKACAKRAGEQRRGKFVVGPVFRASIYARDQFVCQLCMEPTDPEADPASAWFPSLDHIMPRSKGGTDEASNLRTAHRWCNSVRGAEDYHPDLFVAA